MKDKKINQPSHSDASMCSAQLICCTLYFRSKADIY